MYYMHIFLVIHTYISCKTYIYVCKTYIYVCISRVQTRHCRPNRTEHVYHHLHICFLLGNHKTFNPQLPFFSSPLPPPSSSTPPLMTKPQFIASPFPLMPEVYKNILPPSSSSPSSPLPPQVYNNVFLPPPPPSLYGFKFTAD